MIITDFTAGELSPRMAGRVDLELYNKGASELENWTPFLQGGITTRPGTAYIGATKANATGVRLVPFNITDTIAYLLELGVVSGVGYMRFWKLDSLIEATPGNALEYLSSDDPVTFPYTTAAQIAALQFAQDGASLYIAHRSFPPKILTCTSTSANTFTIATITVVGNTGSEPFQSSGNYPGCVAVWGGRLWWASSTNDPQRVWASETWDATNGYTHYHTYDTVSYTTQEATDPATWSDPNVPEYADVTTTKDVVSDSNAIDITLGSEQVEQVQWLAAGQDLIVGCTTSEFVIPKGVTATAMQANLQTRYGSAAIQAFLLADTVVFAQAGAQRIREYYYQDTQAAYQSPDLTYHAEHILGIGITAMDFAQAVQPMLYCVRSDGELAVLAYSKTYGVQAWCRYALEGSGDTFSSVAVINTSSGSDSVYCVATINSVKQIVKFDALLSPTCNLDSYISVTKATTNTIARFASKAVKIIHGTTVYSATADGSGVITMPTAVTNGQSVYVGLAYTCTAKTNKVSQFVLKRVPNVYFMVLASYPFSIVSGSYTDTASFTAPYTGDLKVPYADNWDRAGNIEISNATCLPSTILAIAPEVK